MQWVFGYGSLIYEPELADAVEVRRVAWLDGWRRRFNKRSVARGCLHDEAMGEPLADWLRGERRLSVVLGTEADPTAAMCGVALGYPRDRAAELLDRLLAREGDGYLHHEVRLRTAEGEVDAWTFLTDPRSDWLVDLAPDEVAAVLHAATPRERGPRARGAAYLLRLHEALEALGQPDPYLADLAARVARHRSAR